MLEWTKFYTETKYKITRLPCVSNDRKGKIGIPCGHCPHINVPGILIQGTSGSIEQCVPLSHSFISTEQGGVTPFVFQP